MSSSPQWTSEDQARIQRFAADLPRNEDLETLDPLTCFAAAINTQGGVTGDGKLLHLRVTRVVEHMLQAGKQTMVHYSIYAVPQPPNTFDVAGTPLTANQVLRLHDQSWRPDETEPMLLQRIAAVEPAQTLATVDPATFTTALAAATETILEGAERVGQGVSSLQNRTWTTMVVQTTHYPAESAALLFQHHMQAYFWGVACDIADEGKLMWQCNSRNYRVGLLGYDFDLSQYPSRKAAVHTLLDPLLAAARDDHDRALVRSLIDRADTLPEDADDYPNVVEIVSLGMTEAVAKNSREWVGRYGLDNAETKVYMVIRNKPNRSYQIAKQYHPA